MRIHRIKDHCGDQEIQTVCNEVVYWHRNDSENSTGTNHCSHDEHGDSGAYQSILLASTTPIRDEAHEEERAGPGPGECDDSQENWRSLDVPSLGSEWRDLC